MKTILLSLVVAFFAALVALIAPAVRVQPEALLVGLGETDLTPDPAQKPVYLAGFGKNRKATKIHDPIMARAIVLKHDDKKIAIVSVDLVGLSFEVAERV